MALQCFQAESIDIKASEQYVTLTMPVFKLFSHTFTWSAFSSGFYITLCIFPNRECGSGRNCKCTSVDLCTVFTD